VVTRVASGVRVAAVVERLHGNGRLLRQPFLFVRRPRHLSEKKCRGHVRDWDLRSCVRAFSRSSQIAFFCVSVSQGVLVLVGTPRANKLKVHTNDWVKRAVNFSQLYFLQKKKKRKKERKKKPGYGFIGKRCGKRPSWAT